MNSMTPHGITGLERVKRENLYPLVPSVGCARINRVIVAYSLLLYHKYVDVFYGYLRIDC
jgi:hypothetical protein